MQSRYRLETMPEMKFEFELDETEQRSLKKLNRGNAFGPGQFLILVLACFTPSLLGLVYLKMWGVLIVGAALMFLAGIVPLLVVLRKKPLTTALPRSVTLTPVGIDEVHGTSRSFIKWNHVEELMETRDGFVFGRHSRFTMLPARVILQQGQSLQAIRELLAQYRNVPENPNRPVELFRERFLGDLPAPIWKYDIERSDLRSLFRSALIPVSEKEFAYREVMKTEASSSKFSFFVVMGLLLMSLFLIASSIPRGVRNSVPLLVLSVAPFILMVVAAMWVRRKSYRSLPLIRKESYRVGLFADGWSAGNEDVCTFHKWCQGTRFFLSQDFVGFRIESGVVNIIPRRAIGENQEVFDFVRLAMKLKQESLLRESGESEFGDVPMAALSVSNPEQASNPWASPTSTAKNKKANDNQQNP